MLKQMLNLRTKAVEEKENKLSTKRGESEGGLEIVFVDCTLGNMGNAKTIFDDRSMDSDKEDTPMTTYDDDVNKKLKSLYSFLDQIGSDSLANGMASRPADVDLTYLATDAASPSDVIIGASYTDGLQVRVTYKGKRQELRDLTVLKTK